MSHTDLPDVTVNAIVDYDRDTNETALAVEVKRRRAKDDLIDAAAIDAGFIWTKRADDAPHVDVVAVIRDLAAKVALVVAEERRQRSTIEGLRATIDKQGAELAHWVNRDRRLRPEVNAAAREAGFEVLDDHPPDPAVVIRHLKTRLDHQAEALVLFDKLKARVAGLEQTLVTTTEGLRVERDRLLAETKLIHDAAVASGYPSGDAVSAIQQHHAEYQRAAARVKELERPTPMLIHCPICHTRHVDEGDQATTPHRTHACQNPRCGHLWAPAVVPTVGVWTLPGCLNGPPAPRPGWGESVLIKTTPRSRTIGSSPQGSFTAEEIRAAQDRTSERDQRIRGAPPSVGYQVAEAERRQTPDDNVKAAVDLAGTLLLVDVVEVARQYLSGMWPETTLTPRDLASAVLTLSDEVQRLRRVVKLMREAVES